MVETVRILQVQHAEEDAARVRAAVENDARPVRALRVDSPDTMKQALEAEWWDIVLADYPMASFVGAQALDVLRRHGEDIPLLFIIASVGEEVAVDLMRAGAADCIRKDKLVRLAPAVHREVRDAAHRRARREAERLLRERERILSNAERLAGLGTWELNIDDGTMQWSDALYAILGRSPEAPPAPGDFETLLFPDDREQIRNLSFDALANGAAHHFEHRVRRPDGAIRWVISAIEPEADQYGRVRRLIGTVLDITDRKLSEDALRDSERDYRTLLEQAADGIVVADSHGRIRTINTRAAEMLRYAPDDVLAMPLTAFIEPQDLDQNPLRLDDLQDGRTLTNERNLRRSDGSYVPVETSTRQLDDGRIQIIVRDITERRRAEQALRTAEHEYRNLFESASDAIVVYDLASGEILDANRRTVDLYGTPRCKLLGRSLRDLLGNRTFDELHLSMRADDEGVGRIEASLQRPDGARAHLDVTASEIEFQDRRVVLTIQRDVTVVRELEQQLAHQALHDATTGLPNRALLHNRLEHALIRAGARGQNVATLVLDLDRFKLINESFSHEIGDQLLRGTAERLVRAVRPGDTVARLGGDEFAILLEHNVGIREITWVSERVSDAIQEPLTLEGHDIVVTSSIGIAIAEQGQGRAEDVLRNAEVALYRAKDSGRSRFVIFDRSMNATMLERLRLETDLRRAIDREELRVYFQPTVELASGKLVGLEALVRWRHPTRGLVPPAAFIPLAEEVGLIRTIDQWVLDSACRQLADWRDRYPGVRIRLHVNLSAQGFRHPDLSSDVGASLDASGVTPQDLHLELTESVIMSDDEGTNMRLRELKDLGVRLAIDDFGTGYSSLSYLKHLPVDTLKVDKAFVDGLGSDPGDTAIVEATISIARALGLQVVAEGVERRACADHLLDLGCLLGQGYLFSAPMPPDQLEPILSNGLMLPRAHEGDDSN